MTHAPTVEEPGNRATVVRRSGDGRFYTFEVLCIQGDTLFDLMAGIPIKRSSGNVYHAQFTLPTQIVAEMFAGVAEAAMTPALSEEAAERIVAPT